MGDGTIAVDFADIVRQLEANGHDEVHVEFVPGSGDRTAAVEAMNRAVRAADDEVPEVWGEDARVTIDGTSVRVKDPGSPPSFSAWLATLSRVLRGSGYTGTIHATPTVRLPVWFSRLASPRVTAFVASASPFIDGAAVFGDLPGWCERAAAWATQHGGDTYVSTGGMHQMGTAAGAGRYLDAALRASSLAGLACTHQHPTRARHVALARSGQSVYQVYEADSPPTEQVAQLRDLLAVNAAQTQLAFVTMTPVWAHLWDDRAQAMPPLPTIPPHALRTRPALWSRFVPDAHGMQVLTGEHLHRASDLSAWAVTPLPADRYLVEATNLAAWFGADQPTAEVIAEARRNFGDMIVSTAAVS